MLRESNRIFYSGFHLLRRSSAEYVDWSIPLLVCDYAKEAAAVQWLQVV